MTDEHDASDALLAPADRPGPDPGPHSLSDRSTAIDGATASVVRDALASETALSGADGFAGAIDGRLVRDVLGRRPVYYEASAPTRYAFAPDLLDEPRLLPAGATFDPTSDDRPRDRLTLPDPPPAADAVERVRTTTREAIRDTDSSKTAVAFSGGVDSAFVAWGLPEAALYVAGFPDCHDRAAARTAATAMDREVHHVPIDHATLRRATRAVVTATARTNPMDAAIAVPLWLVGRRAARDGARRLAVGQGADELFGGYAKVVDPANDDRVAADSVRGARRETVLSLPDQLARDVCTLRAAGVAPVTPLLADEVIDAALRLPGGAIADTDRRKRALRAAARGAVPEPAIDADKKAVQYGTYVSRELDRLARQAGFKRRMDDHVGRYVDALVADELDERPITDE